MKYIVKQAEPREFSDFKTPNAEWEPTYKPTYEGLPGPIKKSVKQSLMEEQGYICCYCERELTPENSHIEHFHPQTKFPGRSLDYNNLLCSCQNQFPKKEPLQCGMEKGNWFDAALLVSPLDPGCEDRFFYSGNGSIRAANDTDRAAQTTIQKLKLDLPKLNALRAAVYDVFASFCEYDSNDDIKRIVMRYLERNTADRKFRPFWTTIRHVAASNFGFIL